jgi:hypothetical protein
MKLLSKNVINVWQIEILISNHVHMEDDKHN